MANEGHLYIITADRRIQKPYNVLLRWKERPWSICGSQRSYGLARELALSLFFSFFSRNKQINSNQISLLAVTFKQFNLHPYVKRRAAL